MAERGGADAGAPGSAAFEGAGAPGIHPPHGLLDAVDAYELALMANDLEALDAFFAGGDATMRGDAEGLLVGTPLVAGDPGGALAGCRVAVKDLFDVAGHAVGAGVPAFLAESHPAIASAPAVTALLAAGADVQGIARSDEFAYSIAGRNPHYGTPPNPAVVGGIPGGSSNGPASAVALGQADIGLGTDTGGSIRVPASYQGLWGLRTTHGAVDRGGLLPLAPSFDTVGWITRDSATLATAASVSLPAGDPDAVQLRRFAVCDAATALADTEVRAAFDDALAEWIAAHPGALGADIAGRFAWASGFGPVEEEAARAIVLTARADIERALDGRVLLLPAASSAAPQTNLGAAENEATRAATLRLTCIAGIAGLPALSVPLLRVADGPVGLCLVGPRGSDLELIEVGERMAHPRR